jgi:glycosyltransferase involved in cell wall biosynthesis
LLPEEVEPILALPGEKPDWLELPTQISLQSIPQMNPSEDRLRWEQRVLPKLAGELKINLAHLTHNHPPLLASVPTIISPGELPGGRIDPGITGRLRSALGQGGMAGAQGVVWPADIPGPDGRNPAQKLTPAVHPDFYPSSQPHEASLDLPETYILYHGSFRSEELRLLFEAWVWGAGALGDYYPLLILGGQDTQKSLIRNLERYDFGEAVRTLPTLAPRDIPAVYRGASALIHPGIEVPWGGAIRHALTCGVPVVTIDHPRNSALVGAAAYTIPARDARKLGASLITVIVEEDVSQKLSKAALEQASGWDPIKFRAGLLESYKRFAKKN